jgi:hypothetical protein
VVTVFYSLRALLGTREIVSIAELAWRGLGPSLLLIAAGTALLLGVNRARR